MSTNIERAAEVIGAQLDRLALKNVLDEDGAHIALALAAEGLLVTERTAHDLLNPSALNDCPYIVMGDEGTGHCALNLTDEQEWLIRLGEAVEAAKARHNQMMDEYGYTIETTLGLLRAIYAEAERSRG